MKLLIIGGGALGTQALRLAKAAGIFTLLADKNAACPGKELADEFAVLDAAKAELPAADKILPCVEDEAVLFRLGENAVFHRPTWEMTASRLRADEFLREKDIPAPAYFPEGSEPYLVKPDRGSFGTGIWVTEDFCEVGGAVNAGFVTQEELPGDTWSVVITGCPGVYKVHAPARLQFDGRKRVSAVCEPAPEEELLRATALRTAEALKAEGILEIEAMLAQGKWKVTDINARLPMCTPDALLETGVNLLAEIL